MAQADVRVDSVAYPNPNPTLAAALDRGPIVADGGLSTVLDQLGTPASGPLWTGEVLASRPCLLYTSPSPRDRTRTRMPSPA